MFFFFKQKTAYEWRISDWSSDVCSSDLEDPAVGDVFAGGAGEAGRGGVEQDVVVDVVESGRLRAARGHALQQRFTDAGRTGAHGDVAMVGHQPLAVLQPTQFLHRRYRVMRVRTDAPGAAGIEVGAQREQAVAEIGLGGRADRNGGAAGGDAAGFFRRRSEEHTSEL